MVNSPACNERRKRTHPKVRTGCQTCKSRRVKCPEERPKCSRCQASGRTCIYAVPTTWLFEPHQSKELATLQSQPSTTLGNRDEQRAFAFFKQNTAPQFGGQHDMGRKFFSIFIPRSASNDPLIFKLVVAVGSKHEASLIGSSKAESLASNSHALAVSTLARTVPQMRVDMSLLSCTLLGAYANICEEVPATSAMHISLGMKILREQTSDQEAPEDSIRAYIVPMFTELEMIAALFTIWSPEVEIVWPKAMSKPALPASFDDLYHAKKILGVLLRWRLYVTASFRGSLELASKMSEADELLGAWRQTLIRYSMQVAQTYPGLYIKAQRMLFQYKIYGMSRRLAMYSTFQQVCRVYILSADFTQPHITSIICTSRDNHVVDDNYWPLLASQRPRQQAEDDLDLWPRGVPVGHDGPYQITRIALGY